MLNIIKECVMCGRFNRYLKRTCKGVLISLKIFYISKISELDWTADTAYSIPLSGVYVKSCTKFSGHLEFTARLDPEIYRTVTIIYMNVQFI